MTGPRILVVQHEDQCPPAWFGTWLTEAGAQLDVRRPYAGEALPVDLGEHDGLLVLGGHMGAYDDAEFGWLTPTKALVRDAVDSRTPTFGICLGHQLVAVALGGTVIVNPRGQQLGVLTLGWSDEDDALFGALPVRGIQWNNDVVDRLPEGALALARTGHGELQAARFADTVWGVQLHPEADEVVVHPWAEADRPLQGDAAIDAALADVLREREALFAQWQPVAQAFARMASRRVLGNAPGAPPRTRP